MYRECKLDSAPFGVWLRLHLVQGTWRFLQNRCKFEVHAPLILNQPRQRTSGSKKAMRKFLLLTLNIIAVITYAQNLQTVKTYYDPYTKTRLNEVYTVLAGTPTKHGSYKAYDEQGILVKEATYSNGIANGPYKEYYSSRYGLDDRGKLGLSENYKNGKLDGISEDYAYPGGKKRTAETRTYAMGELLKKVGYYETGEKATERDYKTGSFTEWYENGQKKETGKYDSYGYKTGSYTKWYDNGQVMETKKDSAEVILAMEYHEDGGKTYAVVLTVGGTYISTTLDTLGRKAEEAESKPSGRTPPFYYDGSYTAYWPSGEVKTVGQHRNGLRVGKWKYFAIDGKVLSDAEWPQGTENMKEELRRVIREKASLLTNVEVDRVEALIKRGTDDGYQQALDILWSK